MGLLLLVVREEGLQTSPVMSLFPSLVMPVKTLVMKEQGKVALLLNGIFFVSKT